ncbi:helix-turn-helix domain-containing protein [Sphingobacterium sp. lm-10]|uniref:AraC family transcriptional regulator n=1 Tax=Sphingobacterium sp. lm-10 TaxID=2944904 RepID=UPI00201FE2A1|nr:helix-turn-helix domain-containing protein [Sphingobacterium sp. lm-10]MCL7987310.1 helix-turn-helix domain-containing protein [Sphingobacterium sp. lm-10]
MKTIETLAFKPTSNSGQNLYVSPLDSHLNCGQEILLKPHRTYFFMMIWVTDGMLDYHIDQHLCHIEKNNLIYIAPDQIHYFNNQTGFEGELIAFTEDFIPQSAFFPLLHIFNNAYATVKNIQSKEILIKVQTLFRSLSEELKKEPDEFQHALLFNMLYNLILFIERGKVVQQVTDMASKDFQDIIAFKSLVAKNYREHFNVRDYAEILDITTQRLGQISAAALGKTPKEYIMEYMLTEARRMLNYSNESVKEISFSLGFDEPTNFTKYFKKHTGISPLIYRRNGDLQRKG